ITTTSGNIQFFNGNGDLTMVDGTVFNAGNGQVNINGTNDLTVGQLISNVAGGNGITLSLTGSVLDAGDTGGEDFLAPNADVFATSGAAWSDIEMDIAG